MGGTHSITGIISNARSWAVCLSCESLSLICVLPDAARPGIAESWESEDAMLILRLSVETPGLRLRRAARCEDVERCLCLCLAVLDGDDGIDLNVVDEEAARTRWEEEKVSAGGGRW